MAIKKLFTEMKYGDFDKLEKRVEWIDLQTGQPAAAEDVVNSSQRTRSRVRELEQVFIQDRGWTCVDYIIFNIGYKFAEYLSESTKETLDDIEFSQYRKKEASYFNESALKQYYVGHYNSFIAYSNRYIYFVVDSDLGHYYTHVPRDPDVDFLLDLVV